MLLFLDIDTNSGSEYVPAVCRIFFSNVWGLADNLTDLTVLYLSMTYCTVLLWDFGLRYASSVRVAGSQFWLPCLLPGQDALSRRDGGIHMGWIWNASPTQIWVLFLEKAGFQALWHETELLCVQTLQQPWPRWPDFWLFTNINGCHAGWGCACLFPLWRQFWNSHHQQTSQQASYS